MLNYNYLSEDIRDFFDYVEDDMCSKKDGYVLRDDIEPLIIDTISDLAVILRILRRKNTTSIIMLLSEEFGDREGEIKEVKLTVRFEEGKYLSHVFYGITFERDFEYYSYI